MSRQELSNDTHIVNVYLILNFGHIFLSLEQPKNTKKVKELKNRKKKIRKFSTCPKYDQNFKLSIH